MQVAEYMSKFEPKQRRSEETLKKILKALRDLIEDQYFEHITIQDIASSAGVSVGTFYRRFPNKESILPLLYEHQTSSPIDTSEDKWRKASREKAISMVVRENFFMKENKGLMRTIHLYSRLTSNHLDQRHVAQRSSDYARLC